MQVQFPVYCLKTLAGPTTDKAVLF